MKSSFWLILFFIPVGLFSQSDSTKLVFEPAGGIFTKPVSVVLTSDLPNARIYYTLDGSEPGSGSTKYTKPIAVSKVAVIRAIAYGDGGTSKIITNSYFCDRTYSLPIVSITTNPANLWDFTSGIYVKGCCADTVPPYLGANFWYDWEKRANVEMYEPTGECAFNQVAGIGIFGGFSKGLPQKSLYVIARERYGKKKFDYPIFPERDIDSYKSFILRNAGGDFGKTHFRDAFMTQLAKPTGLAIQEYRPAIVFLNGEYWGIQNLREKINEHYLEDNFGVDKDNVDLMEHRDGAKHGTSKQYKYLLNYLATKDMTNDQVIEDLRKFMDIENYMSYNIAEVYSDNRDAGGNIRYYKERNDSSRWRWILYDTEMGLGNNNPKGYMNNTLKKFTSVNNEIWPDPPWSTFIIRSLLSNKKLETQYINMFADQLNTVYHPDTAVRLMNKIADGIRTEIPFHQKRWGSTMKAWEENVAVLKTFITKRPYYLRQFIMEKFALTDTAYVSVYYPGKEQGSVTLNSIEIKRNFVDGVYFKGVPITITATPQHDYEFIGWKNRSEKTQSISVLLTEDTEFIPLFQPKRKSVFSDSVFFNEICFFQHESDTSGDWVELYNHSKKDIDISGWVFTDGKYKDGFKIPAGTVLKSNGYVVVCEFAERIKSAGSVSVGNMDFGLSKKGEKISLYDAEGFLIDSLSYMAYSKDLHGEETFSLSLTHPDSSGSVTAWINENINPGESSFAYRNFLQSEAEKAYWTKALLIGGGGFFFMLAVGLWYFRSFKKRLNKQ